MKRSPLARKTRLKPKRTKPRKSGRVLDEAYLEKVRQLPCYVCGVPGMSDPDHQGKRPFGRKADDSTAVPMCRGCHSKRTDGYAWNFVANEWYRASKLVMSAWCGWAISRTRGALGWAPKKEDDQ